jgi:hypothetical protein
MGLTPAVNRIVQKITDNILRNFLSSTGIIPRLHHNTPPTITPSSNPPVNNSPTPIHDQSYVPASELTVQEWN